MSKDTFSGLHLILNEHNTYGDFIGIVNVLLKEKALTYVIKDYDVWFFNFYPVQSMKSENNLLVGCGTADVIHHSASPPLIENDSIMIRLGITELVHDIKLLFLIWPVLLLFLVLVFISIRKNNLKITFHFLSF